MRVHVVIQTVILVSLALCASASRFRDFRFMSKNITSTLDTLLSKERYDKRLRPDLGGPPTLVTVSVYIKSMSSVSELEQRYSMDTYFRQSWFDPRLRFSLPGIDEFSMSWLFLDRVWKPDTFIVNGHRSYLHRITVPNKFARVRSDGFVTYSMRLTVQASCPMHFRKFPLDSQSCPLLISSYGYTSADIIYAWHPTKVGLEPGVELAQYDLVNITTSPEKRIKRGSGEYSMISAAFHLRRNTGYYTLQVFVPCGLIVCSSWVSFWIDPDAVPARVSLGVTTVLSMTTMGFGARAALPRVNYATAFDWFVILCFAFVFAVMVEYAAINFIDKVTVDLRRILEERRKDKKRKSTASMAEGASANDPTALSTTAAASVRGTPKRARTPADTSEIVMLPPSDAADAIGTATFRDVPREASATSSVEPVDTVVQSTTKFKGLHPSHSVVEDDIQYADPVRPHSIGKQTSSTDYVIVPLETGDRPDVSDSVTFSGVLLPEPGSLKLGRTHSLQRCLSAPYRLWERTRFLPSEDDVRRQMQNSEEPDKFTRIDIVSRRVFPTAFGSMLILYYILYTYYITDMFPEDEGKSVLYDLAHRHN